jgi:hypothetical protein
MDMPWQLGRRGWSNDLKHFILKIEDIRLDLMYLRRSDIIDFDMLIDVRRKISDLLEDNSFVDAAHRIKFRPAPPSAMPLLPGIESEKEYQVDEVLKIVLGSIHGFFENSSSDKSSSRAAALLRAVPEQKLAPVIFDIVSGKLTIVKQSATANRQDADNARRARELLMDRGKTIIEALEKSNCDRRVLDSLRELQFGLSNEENIIELGLVNIGVERVCKSAAAELPEALLGAIDGHIAGVGMYVAQFDDWRRFCEHAASVELDAADIESIYRSSQSIIEQIHKNPDIADANVPKTLQALNALVANPRSASKRAAFAVLRTVENVVAKIFQYGADYLDQTARKTVDGLSTTTSKFAIGTLIAIALSATTNLGSVPGKLVETGWMRAAAEIVTKQLEKGLDEWK